MRSISRISLMLTWIAKAETGSTTLFVTRRKLPVHTEMSFAGTAIMQNAKTLGASMSDTDSETDRFVSGNDDAPARNIRLTGQAISNWFIFRYILGLIGICMALITPASITLGIRVGQLDPSNKASSLALVASLGAAAALFANPLFGLLSDKCVSRFGQRKPFIFGGVLFGGLSIAAIGFAPTIGWVACGWMLAQISFNAAIAATIAIMPERIPNELRGKVSGLMGIAPQVGVLSGVLMVQQVGVNGFEMFVFPTILGLIFISPLVFMLREATKTRGEVGPVYLRDILSAYWINPFEHRDFALAWVGRFLTWTSLYLLTTYKTYFLIDHLGYTTSTVAPILTKAMFILAVCVILSSIPGGWLSDYFKRRKIFVSGASVLFSVGMLVVATAHSAEQFLVGIAISGIAQGLYLGVDYALVAQVLPDNKNDAAKGMGFFNLSSAIPQTIAPLLAPLFLMIGQTGSNGNYTSLYLFAAGFALLGAISIQAIRGVK